MNHRHAFLVIALTLPFTGADVSRAGVEKPADSIPAHVLARLPQFKPIRAADKQSIRRTKSRPLAPWLVMFIPWSDAPPTPPVPTVPGNGGNGPDGGDGQNGGNGQNNGGNGNPSGGNGQTGGGNGNQSGGGSSDSGGSGGSGGSKGSGGSGEPGGPPRLGGGNTHINPEPASILTSLIGAGLLGLAGLRRLRWSMK
jgi:hypothetical protein